MEYISMSQEEALNKCSEFSHYIDKEYKDKQTGRNAVVIDIAIFPSQEEYLLKMSEYVTVSFRGENMLHEIDELLLKYNKDEFTPVVVSRLTALSPLEQSVPVGYSYLPIQYLADQNGELHLGFDL